MKTGLPWSPSATLVVLSNPGFRDGKAAPMRNVHIIPLDTHCQSTEYGVMTSSGRITRRGHCPTTIKALREVIESVARPRHGVFEEGPLAHWLWRNLREAADEVVVCDPRRNHLIARDGDKDDAID